MTTQLWEKVVMALVPPCSDWHPCVVIAPQRVQGKGRGEEGRGAAVTSRCTLSTSTDLGLGLPPLPSPSPWRRPQGLRAEVLPGALFPSGAAPGTHWGLCANLAS